jgi:DNA modification methylase
MAKNIPQLVSLPINEIQLLEDNPRTISDKEFKALCKDLKKDPNFLIQKPPLVNNITSKGIKVCYAGNQRLKALKHLGYTEITVWMENDVPKAIQDDRMLKDNLHRGEWNLDMLSMFDTSFLQSAGFGDDFMSNMFKERVEVTEDGFNTEEVAAKILTPKTKIGDMYQLGNHRLVCGNSEDLETIKRLFEPEEHPIMIYCDPPYNIGLSYDKGIKGNSTKKTYTDKHFNDNMKATDYIQWLIKTINNALAVTNGNAHVFYWCDPKFIGQVQEAYLATKVKNKNVCVWLKNQFNPVTQIAFNRIIEPCVYGTYGKPYLFDEVRNLSEVLNKEATGTNMNEYFASTLDVWFSQRVRTNEYVHPTQKPITLHDKPIRRCSVPGDIVLDLFGGSGSTLIACEQMKRSARLVELDPVFCDVIVQRWEQVTNLKATLTSKAKSLQLK